MIEMNNCVDIVRPFVEDMSKRPELRYQVIGGTGSAALALTSTLIVPEEGLVIAQPGLHVDRYRKDGNLRDLDLLVLSSQQPVIDAVEAKAHNWIGKGLEISVFGMHPMSALRHRQEHPLRGTAVSWLSDRYVEESGGNITALKKGLYPLAVDVDLATLESFHLQVGNDPVLTPIPHPGTTLLNYLTRSISGLRPKDTEKILGTEDVQGLARTVLAIPGMKEWIFECPGKELVRFAAILHGMRQGIRHQDALVLDKTVAIEPVDPRTVRWAPEFLDKRGDYKPSARMSAVMTAARLKSRGLHFLESREKMGPPFKRGVEHVIQNLLKTNQ